MCSRSAAVHALKACRAALDIQGSVNAVFRANSFQGSSCTVPASCMQSPLLAFSRAFPARIRALSIMADAQPSRGGGGPGRSGRRRPRGRGPPGQGRNFHSESMEVPTDGGSRYKMQQVGRAGAEVDAWGAPVQPKEHFSDEPGAKKRQRQRNRGRGQGRGGGDRQSDAHSSFTSGTWQRSDSQASRGSLPPHQRRPAPSLPPSGAPSFEASLNRRAQHTDSAGAKGSGAHAHASKLKFEDIPGLHTHTLAALTEDFGYQFATPVQRDTIQPALQGLDILARARTGTGKTLGFVVPAIERVRAQVANSAKTAAHVVIVSPTRELASQIAAEANVVCKRHGNNFGVQLLVGGTSLPADVRRLQKGPNTLLVCTVGRFHDHADNTPGFRDMLKTVAVVVLDECDRLLEMGFREEVTKLLKTLPSASSRQTLLFSATMPQNLNSITDLALHKNHKYVDCVGEESPETAVMAEQRAAVVPKDEWLPRLAQLIHEGMQHPDYKIMVFCTTARTAGFLADLFNHMRTPGVSQIHSRMTQTARTRVSNEFRNADRGVIMFTSDVSARGVDYPGTTLVLQVGLPSSRETYVHRLGRTARAGAGGQGVLLLCTYERSFLQHSLKGLPVKDVSETLPPLPSENSGVAWFDALQRARQALDAHEDLNMRACQAYVAWMGYMNSNLRILKWDKKALVQEAAEYAGQLGLSETPIVQKKTIGKMGLKGIPGLRYS